MISEGQLSDIRYTIPLLEHVKINGSRLLADRSYNSNKLIYYTYVRRGKPTIPFCTEI